MRAGRRRVLTFSGPDPRRLRALFEPPAAAPAADPIAAELGLLFGRLLAEARLVGSPAQIDAFEARLALALQTETERLMVEVQR